MSENSTPNFFLVLDMVIKAFHLDHEEPRLRGKGTFQHQLTGWRFDIKDKGFRQLLTLFGSALRRSGVFPVLGKSLRCDGPAARVPAVLHYLGEAQSLPPGLGDLDATMLKRLTWLADQHEAFLGKARSRVVADDIDPAFGLMPLMRFAWHHLTMALAMLQSSELMEENDLRADAPNMTWWMEHPTTTPMSEARRAAKISLERLGLDLAEGSEFKRSWDEKTVANLESGGPAHPEFESIEAAVRELCPGDQTQLPRWRRWYGLRHLARQFADLWGWEWLNGCLATTLAHAHVNATCMKESSLDANQRRVVASVGIWAGWRLGFARWAFGEGATGPVNDIHPVLRLDYLSIANYGEVTRIQDCIHIACFGPALEASLRDSGRDAVAARREALHMIWMFQGDQSEFRHLHPITELLHAKTARDWPAMERAARALVEQRPDLSDNHRVLVDAVANQGRFDEALAMAQQALTLFPTDAGLLMNEVAVLMMRGDLSTDARDFEAALNKLLAMSLADSEWNGHLHLADCYLALGDWAAAREECRLVAIRNDQCGEARAIAAICSEKLGERQPANKAAEHAARRGEKGLVDLLRERDRLGELGKGTILPVPRWHRLWVFRA